MLTQRTETARAIGRKDEAKSKRKYSCKYYLKKSGTNLRVCKTMFQNTLLIGEWMAFQWQDEKNEETLEEDDENINMNGEEMDPKRKKL